MAPPTKDIRIDGFGSDLSTLPGGITSVTMLGSDEVLVWEHTGDALTIRKPQSIPSELAVGFRIKLNVRGEIGIGGEEVDGAGGGD